MRARILRDLTIMALSMGVFVRCDCESEQFIPAASYTPDSVLDFGSVSVNAEKTLQIKVLSSGRAALKILAANIQNGDAAKFPYIVADDLTNGLRPAATSSITVTYRPCPDAWNGDALKETFDYNTCPGAPDSAELVIVEDMTRIGSTTILLSGKPVQPPVAEVQCQNSMPACNAAMPIISGCVSMNFGDIRAGNTPCDMVVEVQNKFRGDKATGDLKIERIDVTVQELQEGRTEEGITAGFQLLQMDGSPLSVTPDTPLVVEAPTANSRCGTDMTIAQCNNKRFKIRFDGRATGTWFGSDQFGMTGVRLYTTDPDKRVIKFNIVGTGSAPEIVCNPTQLNFGPVEQNQTQTRTSTCSNFGTSDLIISELRFESNAMNTFEVMSDRGATPIVLAANQNTKLSVSCTPRTTGDFVDKLLIGNNDPKANNLVSIPVLCGAVPKLRVDPTDVLVFPNPEPPPAPPRNGTLVVSNVGFGDLEIQRLEITGPNGDPMSASVDDFKIVECQAQSPSNPCDFSPPKVLCPPSSDTCPPGSSQQMFTIAYQNNDVSTVDYAELHIRTNDRTDMDHIVVLNAMDIPCFYPTPVITVLTPRPCVGMPVEISAMSSTPGGSGMTMITEYSWSWLFTPAASPAFSANNSNNPTSSFMPTEGGTYILGLDVVNDCGQRSQASASETINVLDQCGM